MHSWLKLSVALHSVQQQVVGASGGKLVSIFDGETEYHLGRWIRSKRGAVGWPPLDSCFYACPSPEAAIEVTFPKNSRLSKAPRVLLQVCFVLSRHRRGKSYSYCAHGSNLLSCRCR